MTSEAAYLEDYVLGLGDTLEMSCDLDGPPQPVVWLKDGAGVAPSNRTHAGQRVLRVVNASYEDAGVYTCWLARSNLLLSNFTVRVTGEPRTCSAAQGGVQTRAEVLKLRIRRLSTRQQRKGLITAKLNYRNCKLESHKIVSESHKIAS